MHVRLIDRHDDGLVLWRGWKRLSSNVHFSIDQSKSIFQTIHLCFCLFKIFEWCVFQKRSEVWFAASHLSTNTASSLVPTCHHLSDCHTACLAKRGINTPPIPLIKAWASDSSIIELHLSLFTALSFSCLAFSSIQKKKRQLSLPGIFTTELLFVTVSLNLGTSLDLDEQAAPVNTDWQ